MLFSFSFRELTWIDEDARVPRSVALPSGGLFSKSIFCFLFLSLLNFSLSSRGGEGAVCGGVGGEGAFLEEEEDPIQVFFVFLCLNFIRASVLALEGPWPLFFFLFSWAGCGWSWPQQNPQTR